MLWVLATAREQERCRLATKKPYVSSYSWSTEGKVQENRRNYTWGKGKRTDAYLFKSLLHPHNKQEGQHSQLLHSSKWLHKIHSNGGSDPAAVDGLTGVGTSTTDWGEEATFLGFQMFMPSSAQGWQPWQVLKDADLLQCLHQTAAKTYNYRGAGLPYLQCLGLVFIFFPYWHSGNQIKTTEWAKLIPGLWIGLSWWVSVKPQTTSPA